jgi:hypothetical protein
MNRRFLLGALAAVLVMTAACGKSANTNSNTNKPAASPSPSTAAASSPAAAPASSAAASSEANQDFTLVNATGVEIDKVYITPHSSNDWEDDILGQDTLADGAKVDIKFHRSEKAAMWDLRIEDKEGTSIEWENLNLLEISKVTLHFKGGKATAETE